MFYITAMQRCALFATLKASIETIHYDKQNKRIVLPIATHLTNI